MATMEHPIGSSNSQTISTTSFFTPLLVSIMGIGVTALAILFYHLLLVRYCIRRHAARMAALRHHRGDIVPSGVDEKTLLTIPIITYKSDSDLLTESECAVCLGDFEDEDRVRFLPNCKHLFHVKCIDKWFVGHTSCPVCRVPVCRSVGTTDDDVTSVGSDDRTNGSINNGGGLISSGPRIMLRHCHSMVLPREKKKGFTGMELKRSLSMGQSCCVIVDINLDNVDKDCTYYWLFKDESVRQIQRVSSKVRNSISRMCIGQGEESGILPY